MKTEKTAIYVDLAELHIKLYKAQFTMTKGDRIIMGNRLLDLNQECVSLMSMAVNSNIESERLGYIERLMGTFDALRLNLQTAEKLSMFKSTKATVGDPVQVRLDKLILAIFENVARIDDGIGRWRSAVKARAGAN